LYQLKKNAYYEKKMNAKMNADNYSSPIIGFTPAIIPCLSQGRIWISNTICRGLCLFNLYWLRCELVVSFVDIGGIVEHYCLKSMQICINSKRMLTMKKKWMPRWTRTITVAGSPNARSKLPTSYTHVFIFSVLHHWASFTWECHGTADFLSTDHVYLWHNQS
jgi:hypothetical protein